MKRSTLKVICGAVLIFASNSNAVRAQVINLSTGVNNGVALAAGVIDPNWLTVHAGEATFNNRVVSDAINAGCACGILPNASTGQWININGAANSGWPVGLVNETFRSFSLSGYNLNTVSIAGEWAAMDNNLGLYLNGTLIPGTAILSSSTPWTSLHAFSITGATNFRSGLNELSFHSTTNDGVFDGVMLRDAFVRGTVVPEPGSAILLMSGLAGLALALRRQRTR